MEFVDRLETHIARPKPGASTPASTKGRLMDRQLDVIEGSMKTAQSDLEKPESVNIHVLLDYTHEIKGLEGLELADANYGTPARVYVSLCRIEKHFN